jgi:hypothetical protein
MGAPCDPKVPVGFKNGSFENGSSDGGASDGSLIGTTISALEGLKKGASDVLGAWVCTLCEHRVTDDSKTAWFLPWGSFKSGVSEGSLVGITIGAVVGVEETNKPRGITIEAPVDVVETEGFTNRPRDASDSEPITIGAAFVVGET